MPSANTGSLRDRRCAELLSQIQDTAHQLFAEHGFAAVTTEDIAAAVGISISTYFRYAPTKEELLVAPLRQTVAEIVDSYGVQPAGQSAVEALIQSLVETAWNKTDQNLRHWRQAILTAPHLLSEPTLISIEDDCEFVELVAARMGLDAAIDIRPSLLVHTGLSTAQFILRCWLSTDPKTKPPLHVQLEQALRITLAGFD
ncbi:MULTISPECIES: TetR/AcrR family transcriptional regulator [Mycobacterium]|uniref:Regulator n=1 Tax=Mycobacterium asiaticum TaxID=1790 RepID=A0A1A3KTN2_MYCAS|nr:MULTISPECIES: TetR/AcrR family transcriptional regulator [Mycobacterium]OBI98919.1 regulator [Mycobacterium asiaticum]OBJ87789.1 regulator [Mycobacterium asiaticum]TDK88379.1 TetR family transcriptional regulator [Mycobacterium paragordonae]